MGGVHKAAIVAMGDTLHSYHQAAISPYWSRLQTLVDADRTVRTRALLDDGVEGLLNSLRPVPQWHSPVLMGDRDLHLNGRGLVPVTAAASSAEGYSGDIAGR